MTSVTANETWDRGELTVPKNLTKYHTQHIDIMNSPYGAHFEAIDIHGPSNVVEERTRLILAAPKMQDLLTRIVDAYYQDPNQRALNAALDDAVELMGELNGTGKDRGTEHRLR